MQLWDVLSVRGDLKKGRELWNEICPICKFHESYKYPSAIETGAGVAGHGYGRVEETVCAVDRRAEEGVEAAA